MRRIHFLVSILSLTLVACLQRPVVEINIINVNQLHQGDAHLVTTVGGKTVFIDGGYASQSKRELLPFLRGRHVRKIDLAIISHAHKDHYEGILELVNDGVEIETLLHNRPDRQLCNKEKPWGCDYQHFASFLKKVKKSVSQVVRIDPSSLYRKVLFEDSGLKVRLLHNHEGSSADSEFQPAGINDTSLVFSVDYRNFRMLFTGDMNVNLGSHILTRDRANYRSAVIKVPHHGTESLAANSFFDFVDALYAVVPSPYPLWCSDRSRRVREYFTNNNVPVYLNGMHGNITVRTDGDYFSVYAQNGLPPFTNCPKGK